MHLSPRSLPPPHPPAAAAPRLPRWKAACTAAAFLLAIRTDAPLVRLVHAHSSPAIDRAFDTLSGLASAELATLAGLAMLATGHLLLARGAPPTRARAERLVRSGVLLLCTLASGGAITWLLKHLVARARPQLLIEQGFNGFGLPFAGHPFTSFPSSHAFTAFALAAVAGRLQPALQRPALLLAVAAAACRVLTLEHYPTDVMFSALIGYGCAQFWAVRSLDPRAAWPLRRPWARPPRQA